MLPTLSIFGWRNLRCLTRCGTIQMGPTFLFSFSSLALLALGSSSWSSLFSPSWNESTILRDTSSTHSPESIIVNYNTFLSIINFSIFKIQWSLLHTFKINLTVKIACSVNCFEMLLSKVSFNIYRLCIAINSDNFRSHSQMVANVTTY